METGLSVSDQGRTANTSGCSSTRGASSRGTTRTAGGIGGHDQHGQALERHGLVSGQPGQVGTQRQKQGFHAELGHPLPDPVQAGRPGPAHANEPEAARGPPLAAVPSGTDRRARADAACRAW